MARKKPVIRNADELNAAVLRLGQLELAHKEMIFVYEQRAQEMKEQTEEHVQPVVDEKAALLGAIEQYAEAHREDLLAEGGKSKKLFWGVVGWRASSALTKFKKYTWDQVIKKLRAMGLEHCIITTERVDKDGLKRLTAEQIKDAGCSIDDRDRFYVEPDLVEIANYKPAA